MALPGLNGLMEGAARRIERVGKRIRRGPLHVS